MPASLEAVRRASARVLDRLRPLGYAAALVAGLWAANYMLSRYPWHHMTVVWVIGAVVAAYGAFGVGRELRDRFVLWRWLKLPTEDAAGSLGKAHRAANRLPAMWHERYVSKRHTLPAGKQRQGRRRRRR